MNLTIEKKHNEQIVIRRNLIDIGMEDDKVLSVKNIVIEVRVGDEAKKTGETYYGVILGFSDGTEGIWNNKEDNITLDMKFGGDYELRTYGSDNELKKGIIFSKGGEILGRIQKFRYELSTETTYGKVEMELFLT